MAETVIDIIMKATYSENREQLQSSSDGNTFVHPFSSKILLNSSENKPPQDLIERVLNVENFEKSVVDNQESSPDLVDKITFNETYSLYSFPPEVKSKLKEMFLKPRLVVEAKPRGSIDRKLSCCSVGSSKRFSRNVATRSKSQKLSSIDNESGKRVSIDNEEINVVNHEQRKSSIKCAVKKRESSLFLKKDVTTKMDNNKSTTFEILKNLEVSRQSVDYQRGTDFFLSPIHYNAFHVDDDPNEDTDDEQGKRLREKMFSWSKKETARRKVVKWLHTSCAT